MKKYLLAIPVLAAIAYLPSCNSASAGNTVDLKFKLPKGNKYEYAMNMEMKMNQKIMDKDVDMKNNIGFTYLFEVMNDSASWKTVTSTITKISMDMDAMGRSMHFDSDMPADSAEAGPMAIMGRVFGAMKGAQFSFTVNDKGEIGKVTGLQEMRDKMLEGLPPGEDRPAPSEMNSAFNEESMKQNMQQAFEAYPGKPVKPGDSWTKSMTQNINNMSVKSDNTYTLESVNGNDATVKVVTKMTLAGTGRENPGEMTMNGTGQGKTHYDLETGIATDGDMDVKMDMKVKANKTEMPMTWNMKIKIKGKKL